MMSRRFALGIYSPPYREGQGEGLSVCLKYRQQNRGTYNETK